MRPRTNTFFYGAAILILGVSLFALVRLLHQFENDLETSLEALKRVFSDETVLKTPSDPSIRFSSLEDLARKYEDHGYFKKLTVTKYFGPEERVVYPFFLPAVSKPASFGHPLPAPQQSAVRVLALKPRNEQIGTLYVALDTGPLYMVRFAVGSLSALLVAATLLFLLQFRKQEKEISRTTIELEEKRRELVRLERLALAGQLSANVLHDLKKPMLNIKNELEELDDSAGFPAKRISEQIATFFGILRESNLERFVRSRDEQEYVDVNEIIERSLALVRYERGGVQIALRFDPQLPSVLAGPIRLTQVFSNLILNAYQAMQGNGTLSVETVSDAGGICARISDTGPGIPHEQLSLIFTPFFTTKPEETGTGLGLYITDEIIRELGGNIRVHSSPAGTTFTITLPCDQA